MACTADPAVLKQQYLDSGNQYFDQEKYAEAIIEYRNAIKIDATFGPARKQLAESYARAGNARGAFEEFIRAADLLPTDVQVQLNAGNLLLVARKPEEALARADAALKVDPKNINALVLRGNALAGLSSFEEALEAVEQAIQLDPDRGATFTDLGQVELAQGRRKQAEAAFLKAVELSPKETRSHLALANFYWWSNRNSDAERAFEQALTLEPANMQANRFMASFKYSTGRRDEAEPFLRRIADASNGPEGTLALTDYFLLTGRPKDAITAIESLKSGRDVPAVRLRLARAYTAAGDRAKAHSLVDEALKINDKDARAQLLRGQLLIQEGRGEDAFAAIRLSSTLAPDFADAQSVTALFEFAATGSRSRCIPEVLRLNPRATAAQVQLAMLQAQTTPAESVRTAEDAVRNEPTSAPARLALVQTLIAAKNFSRAEQELTKLRAEYPNVAAVHIQDARLATLQKDVGRARAAVERAEKLAPESIETLRVSLALELTQGMRPQPARIEVRLKQGRARPVGIGCHNLPGTEGPSDRAEIPANGARREPLSHRRLRDVGFDLCESRQNRRSASRIRSRIEEAGEACRSTHHHGDTARAAGQSRRGHEAIRRALAIDSRAGVAANNLAWIFAERGQDLDRALQLAQTAVAGSPDRPEMSILSAGVLKQNQPLRAIPLFQQCIQKSPAVADYHYHLGLALVKSGDNAEGTRVSAARS